jgi:hypothetical protein
MTKIRGPVAALFLITALIVGLCAFTAPADAAPVSTGIVPADWTVKVTPPAKRVIEVVDKVKPTAWRISAAVNWLDRYTASDMRVVAKCSGKAYRCITIRQGRVKAKTSGPVGWSQGSTITIDTTKAASKKYSRWYRYEKNRTWLTIHELGHQFGLGHGTGRHLMNEYVDRYKLVLTAGQKKHLRSR